MVINLRDSALPCKRLEGFLAVVTWGFRAGLDRGWYVPYGCRVICGAGEKKNRRQSAGSFLVFGLRAIGGVPAGQPGDHDLDERGEVAPVGGG